MTRTGAAIRWCGCAVVTVLAVGPTASSQSLAPDPHGFLLARPEDLQPAAGARSIPIVGDSSKLGMYVTRITWAPGSGSRPHDHDQARDEWPCQSRFTRRLS